MKHYVYKASFYILCLSVNIIASALAPPIIIRPEELVTDVPSDWEAQIRLSHGEIPLLFGQAPADPSGQNPRQPLIIALVDGVWKYAKLPDPGNWVAAYQSEDYKHIWAMTEHCPEGCDWHLVVYSSHDGGREWRQQKVRKPHYHMHLHTFGMNADGKGELSFYSEDNVLGKVHGFQRGVYTCTTQDWGNSWGLPKFKADILTKAETADGVYPFDGVADASQIKELMESMKPISSQRDSTEPGSTGPRP